MITVGIDIAEERKGLDLVALDENRTIVASAGRLTVREVTELVLDEIQPLVVCIDSPSQWSISGSSRQAERALRSVGITAFSTGPDPGDHPFYRWMRVGFSAYEALAPRYPRYRGGSVAGTAAEYFPHASAAVLAGGIGPLADKVQFRRGVLSRAGVSTDTLRSLDRIDAALGALTGLIALEGRSCWVGHPDEGALLLPVKDFPATSLLRFERRAGPTAPTVIRSPKRAARPCACGCGEMTRGGRFRPGHDAKLKSRLRRQG